MSRYYSEAAEIEHLEGPELLTVVTMTGSSATHQTPAHIWASEPFGFGDVCARCRLERFDAITKRGGEPQRLYRLGNGQLRMGAEPGCVRRGKR